MNYKIFIISIERNLTRQNSLLEKLLEEGFDKNIIEIFIGVDYKNTKDSLIKKLVSSWGKLTPPSVLSCAASHILLWKYVSILKDIDYAIILEDDSYLTMDGFTKYKNQLESRLSDNTFINLSTAFRILATPKNIQSLFLPCHLVLALDSYILTPTLCGKLFDYYKTFGISYHIDLHLSFIKHQVGFELLHFDKKITKGNLRLESSMVSNHKHKFLLKAIKDKEIYKEANTPFLFLNGLVFNAYNIIVFVLFLLLVISTFLFLSFKSHPLVFILFSFLWLLLGFLFYDVL